MAILCTSLKHSLHFYISWVYNLPFIFEVEMMDALILDGKSLAAIIRHEITQTVLSLSQPLKLAVILVGSNSSSEIYVNNKRKACQEVGIQSEAYQLPSDISEQALLGMIRDLNQDSSVHGILVQLPLPAHIQSAKVIENIAQHKDVDGFHPFNIGCLVQQRPHLRPCTPYGIIQLLKAYQIPMKGKHAVVIGASNIVGRPMALEFLLAGATVTVCHRLTKDLEPFVGQADILVSATGVKGLIKSEWLHKEQVIIDVGIHRSAQGTIHGDIDFASAKQRVAAITPVPGGVGPMTIATLLQNTLLAAQR